jgi:transcriptional regulator with XRE-family HTH domain
MEQAQRGVPEDVGVAGRERAEPIGAYLARQRTLRGITLEQLAASTRIPLRSLRRLESGVFDREPDGFARGFVRTVAVALGLPPDETVARMLPEADGGARERIRLRLWLQRCAVAALVAFAFVVAVWTVTGRQLLPTGWTRHGEAIAYRHDAIRALAAEQRDAAERAFEEAPDEAP